MNILIAANEKYMKHEKVMLSSLRDCMPHEMISVYFMHGKLDEKVGDSFRSYVEEKLLMKLESIEITETPFDSAQFGMHFSVETMYRLMAAELLPGNIDRILWLDGDIVVNNPIHELYEAEFGSATIVACQGRGKIEEHNVRLNLPKEYIYFNAGVVLMNLVKMRETGVTKQFISILSQYGNRLIFLDQDILNITFCHGGVKYYPSEVYNCQIGSDFYLVPNEFEKFKKECCIMHFAATSKPWLITYKNGLQRYYWKYALRDKRYGEFIKYCLIAPLKTIYLRLKWKIGIVKIGA